MLNFPSYFCSYIRPTDVLKISNILGFRDKKEVFRNLIGTTYKIFLSCEYRSCYERYLKSGNLVFKMYMACISNGTKDNGVGNLKFCSGKSMKQHVYFAQSLRFMVYKY